MDTDKLKEKVPKRNEHTRNHNNRTELPPPKSKNRSRNQHPPQVNLTVSEPQISNNDFIKASGEVSGASRGLEDLSSFKQSWTSLAKRMMTGESNK